MREFLRGTAVTAGGDARADSPRSPHEPTDEELNESYRIYLRVRQWTIILPAVFVLGLLVLTVLVLDPSLPRPAAILTGFSLAAAAIAVFSSRVFGVIEPLRQGMLAQNAELRQRTAQLRAVHDAGVSISADLTLGAVLQKIVDSSRAVAGARYGALAVLDEEGRIRDFITSGLTEEERAAIGEIPSGRGLIGHVLATGEPYRSNDILADRHSFGFPEGHPVMRTFLGVPLLYKSRVVGNLYLTEKEGGPFTEQDQDAILTFAVQAAVAIENARLYQKVQENAVLEERQRIGMDLHDGTIQAIYGVGLKLEDCIQRVRTEPDVVEQELDETIEDLNRIIREIRNYIFDLRPMQPPDSDPVSVLSELLREIKVNTLMDAELVVDPDAEWDQVNEDDAWHLQHIVREALANVRKHAHASSVRIEVGRCDGWMVLKVTDNGRGIPANGHTSRGNGLANMAERALAMGGRLSVESVPDEGTTVRLEFPLRA